MGRYLHAVDIRDQILRYDDHIDDESMARAISDEHGVAAFCLDKVQERRHMPSPPKHGHSALLTQLSIDGPELSFFTIAPTFENDLHHVGLDDYELGRLDEWVRCW